MKANFRKTIIASIAVAGIAASGAGYAHGGGSEGRGSYGRGFVQHMGGGYGGRTFRGRHFRGIASLRPYISIALRFSDELKLSGEQVKKMTELRENFYRDMIGERATIRTMRFDLRKTLEANKIDLKSAEKQIAAISKKRANIRIKRIHVIEQGKSILIGEQYKSLQSLLLERRRKKAKSFRPQKF